MKKKKKKKKKIATHLKRIQIYQEFNVKNIFVILFFDVNAGCQLNYCLKEQMFMLPSADNSRWIALYSVSTCLCRHTV